MKYAKPVLYAVAYTVLSVVGGLIQGQSFDWSLVVFMLCGALLVSLAVAKVVETYRAKKANHSPQSGA